MKFKSFTAVIRPNLIAFSNFSLANISAAEIVGSASCCINVLLMNSCIYPDGSEMTGTDGANRMTKRDSARSLGDNIAGKLSRVRISFKPMSFKTYQNMLRCGFVSLFCGLYTFHK